MEADWEFEIAPDAPVIDAAWSGFIDLRNAPDRAGEIAEAAELLALIPTLVRLNAPGSPVWTSKCDVFEPELIDADELDAPAGSHSAALACYIDILPTDPHVWSTIDLIADACRRLCLAVRAQPLRQCRVDLVARAAYRAAGADPTLGITAYLTACGPTPSSAAEYLARALAVFADSVAPVSAPAAPALKLQ